MTGHTRANCMSGQSCGLCRTWDHQAAAEQLAEGRAARAARAGAARAAKAVAAAGPARYIQPDLFAEAEAEAG